LFDWIQPTNRPAIPTWWPVLAWAVAIGVTAALTSGSVVALLVVGASSILVLVVIARHNKRRKKARTRNPATTAPIEP
jgi:hypothetical protein